MEQFTEFIEKYFFYIWLALALWIVLNFYFRGRAAIRQFGSIDYSTIVFSDKSASGYSNKSWKTKRGGASKVLHIIVTDKELIIKTYLFMAYIAKKHDMLHRIPLQNITCTSIKKGTFSSQLHVNFAIEKGEDKEVVLISKNNSQIKEILDRYV